MPSLFSSKPAGSANGSASGFSRINSFQRTWDDEEKADKPPVSSGEIKDWSPSPERIARKNVFPAPAAPAAPAAPRQFVNRRANLTPEEKAADSERRRKAILAALTANAGTSSSSSTTASNAVPSSSTFVAPKPTTQMPTSAQVSRTQSTQAGTQPTLPSVPKREMPWEGHEQRSKRPFSRTTSTSDAAPAKPVKGSGLNIKQKVTLSTEQQKVLQMVVGEGKNMFFTGSAGTGKSVLLREVIKNLRKKHIKSPDAVAVTASTGIAACNIGGITLHSFGGVGLATEDNEVLLRKLRVNKKASARWQRTKVLIIDEVSMVDGALFDKFCKLGQLIRKNDKPFGGIQIVVTGDFFQLPPVTKGGAMPKFAFEAEMWHETIKTSVNLTKVFRQKDPRFVDMLNEMRFGRLSEESIAEFKKLARPLKYDDGIEPTVLFPRREDVDRANLSRLQQLKTEGYTYNSVDGGKSEPAQREKLLSNFMAPKSIELKIDAQVMLIKNVDETLVNGSMGKVIGFCYEPLWDEDSMGRWKPDSDSYEGLSDEDREKRLKLREVLKEKLSAAGKPYPVVTFKVPGGGSRDMLVKDDTFKTELPNGEIQASRVQLPLILSWAMSIHKSQGQTLDRVRVDLGKVFEKGQAYVALSRATSLEGLQVTGFNKDKVMAHKKVATWSDTLQNLND
ncbi:hypothetical protein IAT38_008022 [Cryptococcus sp. DSM 104549]